MSILKILLLCFYRSADLILMLPLYITSFNANLVLRAIINRYFFISKQIFRLCLRDFAGIEPRVQSFSHPLLPRLLPNENRS